jgi:hypothetical protein
MTSLSSTLAPLKLSGTKQIIIGFILAAALLGPLRMLAAGPVPVDLGSTAHFAILSGAAITTTGGGIINGDVGASPITGSAIGIPAAQVNGIIYAVDASGPAGSVMDPVLLTAAKGDLNTAYNAAAARVPVPTGVFLDPGLIPGSGDISGMNLVPGLYKFTGTALIASADVTLTGGPDDVWIFQIASDLEVGNGIHVILAGGAQTRNVFWQVGTSATIGTTAVFAGTILADQSIMMGTSSTLNGRALAFSGGVTFNGVGGSLPVPAAPIFNRILETVTNTTVVLSSTPYFLLTLQTSPLLYATSWTTISTSTPTNSIWTFVDDASKTFTTQRFYRAFITIP